MRLEFFIASRLKLGSHEKNGSPSLNVAMTGIILAIVIMILSVVIVIGFKNEITNKVYSLDSHIKVSNAVLGLDNNYSSVDGNAIKNAIHSNPDLSEKVSSSGLIIEKPAILKTENDFKGIIFRAVDGDFDLSFIKSHIIDGRIISISDTSNVNEIVVSSTIARELGLNVGDKVFTYFIDDKVKLRNSLVTGIYNTDFESHDKAYVIGNIEQLQGINGWSENTGNYVGINVNDIADVDAVAKKIFSLLAIDTYNDDSNTILHNVTATTSNNMQYFTWLSMLDTNVLIIIILMMIVTGFTLIATLLMVVIERIRMIGLFKALGATNKTIRQIFINLTIRLILKAMIIGNVIGIGLALLQKYFHIMKLDPNAYYMPYVPISINIPALLLLNAGIIIISYLTLIAPSYIISTIRPSSTMRFE